MNWQAAGLWFDIIGGFVFILFGLYVGLKRPRTKLGTAGGMFAVGMGLVGTLGNLPAAWKGGRYQLTAHWATGLGLTGFMIGVSLAFLAMGLIVKRRGQMFANWQANVLGLLAIGMFVASAFLPGPSEAQLEAGGAWKLLGTATNMLAAAVTPAMLWLAASVAKRDDTGELIAMAVTPLATGWSIVRMVDFAQDGSWPPLALTTVMIVVAATALDGTRRPLVLWLYAWTFALMAFTVIFADHKPHDLGALGVTRFVAVGLLSYAAVRYRAFDMDVKLRFTIKQSTVAAVFVAVFVAVQTAVGEKITADAGIMAGAGATALLVFALGPIQRGAERLAHTAMPAAIPVSQRGDDERLALYEALVKEAWSDGSIRAKEARVLDVARERLGISLAQAHQVDASART